MTPPDQPELTRGPHQTPALVDVHGKPLDERWHGDAEAAGQAAKPDGAKDPSSTEPTNDPSAKDQPPTEGPKTPHPSKIVIGAMAGIALIGVLLILAAWKLPPFASPVVATDDAYVMGRVTVMAPQVDGYVRRALVRDYQFVRRNQPLIEIDDRIYRQQVDQAQGQLNLAIANYDNSVQTVASDRASLASARADVLSARAERDRAALDDTRLEDLASRGSVSRRERDQGVATFRTAGANVAKALASVRVVREKIKSDVVARGGLAAQIESARAQLGLARINLSDTIIHAPHDGQISDLSAREGQYLAAGSQVVYFVPPEVWVIANFKETQTRHMAPGQPVSIAVDALGGEPLTGHVEVFAPATGSQFSVLKPDNATGNFTKIVQRVAIRIRIDPGQRGLQRLRPGLSVVAKVDTISGTRAERCYVDDPDRPGRSMHVGDHGPGQACPPRRRGPAPS